MKPKQRRSGAFSVKEQKRGSQFQQPKRNMEVPCTRTLRQKN